MSPPAQDEEEHNFFGCENNGRIYHFVILFIALLLYMCVRAQQRRWSSRPRCMRLPLRAVVTPCCPSRNFRRRLPRPRALLAAGHARTCRRRPVVPRRRPCLCSGCFTAIGFMYTYYTPSDAAGSGCPFNPLAITTTLLFNLINTGISLSPLAEHGSILCSGLIFAYSTWLCYAALAAFPVESCNVRHSHGVAPDHAATMPQRRHQLPGCSPYSLPRLTLTHLLAI